MNRVQRPNTTSFAAKPGYYYGESDEFFYPEYGYNNKEVRADRVVFFVMRLDRGVHTFTYLARHALWDIRCSAHTGLSDVCA